MTEKHESDFFYRKKYFLSFYAYFSLYYFYVKSTFDNEIFEIYVSPIFFTGKSPFLMRDRDDPVIIPSLVILRIRTL